MNIHFAHPAYLWSLASLPILIAIHLWNTASGKPLKVGSIQLFRFAEVPLSGLRWQEWPLFLLRCLLITLVCLFVAEPIFIPRPPTGWVLIPEASGTLSSQKKIDSLLARGYQLHYMTDGFPAKKTGGQKLTPWESIDVLNNVLSSDVSVALFAPPRLEDFYGLRARSHGTVVIHPLKDLQVNFRENRTATPAKMPLNVDIFCLRHEESRYLQAAIEAFSVTDSLHMNVHETFLNDQRAQYPSQADFIFWLSNKPCKVIKGDHALLFSYEKNNTGFNPYGLEDTYGRPLVQMTPDSALHYLSTFDLRHDEFVWSEAFPDLIRKIFLTKLRHQRPNYLSEIDSIQMQVTKVPDLKSNYRGSSIGWPIDRPIWLAAFLVLIAERFLSHWNHKQKLA